MYEELKKIIQNSDNIVFFGGAGVSTESNIPDFRSATGLYNQKYHANYSVEEMLSRTYYLHHTEQFFNFYKHHLLFPEAMPNLAHYALARLEKQGKLKAVITQNVDGLHQKAESKNVLELHGSALRNYCEKCKTKYELEYILNSDGVPTCKKCGGVVRPDIVLYEEGLDNQVIQKSIEYIKQADALIIGGTSLVVYPAAGLINYFKGRNLVLINGQATAQDSHADLVIRDKIGKVLDECVKD